MVYEYDCFLYPASKYAFPYDSVSTKVSQTIPYCIRPSHSTDDQPLSIYYPSHLRHIYQTYTFKQLRFEYQRTIENVLKTQHFTSLDDVEEYQLYLTTLNESMSQNQIHLCQSSWFGSNCQYTFIDIDTTGFFSVFSHEVVHFIFNQQRSYNLSKLEMTCYTHLICNRGPPPACLDWREICDGKIDCANDGGIDEKFCEELNVIKCTEQEFRCENGRQCIPKEFYRDDPLNPDCQDGSDEILPSVITVNTYPTVCDRDPAFRCEERTCKEKEFACGDGQCLTKFDTCHNHRERLFMMEVASKKWSNIASLSLFHLTCGTHIKSTTECEKSCWDKTIEICESKLGQLCASTIFKHTPSHSEPSYNMHIFYNYKFNVKQDSWIIVPLSNCINDTYCPDAKIHSDNPTHSWCQRQQRSLNTLYIGSYSRSNLTATINRLVNIYLTDNFQTGNYSWSKYHQLKSVHTDNIANYTTILNMQQDRSDTRNEQTIQILSGHPSYITLCHTKPDLKVVITDGGNHTDETDCDQWPCDNIYTRCDGYANCPNGYDEFNCTVLHCEDNEIPYVSYHSDKMKCLNRKRIRDDIFRCFDGTGGDKSCNNSLILSFSDIFCCFSGECIHQNQICNGRFDCFDGEDELLCNISLPVGMLPYFDCGTHSFCIFTQFGSENCVQHNYPKRGSFSSLNPILYPLAKPNQQTEYLILKVYSIRLNVPKMQNIMEKNHIKVSKTNVHLYCHRGLDMLIVSSSEKNLVERICFCPPSYYGNRCQYQNDRVSLTLSMQSVTTQQTVFIFLIMLIDEERQINSFFIHIYLSSEDCDMKFNNYLLYSSPIKDKKKNYSIHIDVFKQNDLSYYASWYLPINHPLLPVTRIAVLLKIPVERLLPTKSNQCSLKCQQGHCVKYINTEKYFCQCKRGWFGLLCDRMETCHCSIDSICMGSANDRPVCVCPPDQAGPRCLLPSVCTKIRCKNGGTCIYLSDLSDTERLNKWRCICTDEFEGELCENRKIFISLLFNGIETYSFMIVHTVFISTMKFQTQTSVLQKFRTKVATTVIYIPTEIDFNLVFIQFNTRFYLVIVQESNVKSLNISTIVSPERQCHHVHDLLSSTIANFHPLRRSKHYPRLCREQLNTVCFHDERLMCLCTSDRFAHCFEFQYQKNFSCQNSNPCEKEGRCFEDRPICPTRTQCICSECYYGTRCQFSTMGLGVSLDAILGYEIQPMESLFKQPISVKVGASITIIVFIFGVIGSIMSLITFCHSKSREVGCGIYLVSTSVASLLTMIMFTLKFWFLLLTQMSIIVHPLFLRLNCLLMDALTNACLGTSNWLSACIAIERTVTVHRGVLFSKKNSKTIAPWIVTSLILCISLTYLPDPLHRVLLHDDNDQRIWCIVRYPSLVQGFHSTIVFFHYVVPFTINAISAVMIIALRARKEYIAKKKGSYFNYLIKQLHYHNHLFVSPSILVLLTVPRLVLAFLPGCMKSTGDPWIYLAGYMVSFVPSLLVFPIFVLPSRLYRTEFRTQTKRIFNAIINVCRCH